jgi:hypothetical protein
MIKKNIIWFSEINPEYQTDNGLLKRIQNDSTIEVNNIRYCFEPSNRSSELKSSKELEGNLKTVAVEAGPDKLFRESYFADAVAVSKNIFRNNLFPDHLKNIHCPLVIFPEHSHKINHLLFIITSDPNSVISIKQFCCLFEHICKKAKMTLLVIDDGEGLQKPEEQVIVSYLKKWNRNLGIYKDQNWNFEQLKKYLEFDDKTLSVMNLDLILNSEEGSFPREIFEDENTSLFIGYNY